MRALSRRPVPAYIYRARTNLQLDKENKEGLAKPHYEGLIKASEGNTNARNKDLVEAHEYLGYYNWQNKKYDDACMHYNKVLELDKTHAKARTAISQIPGCSK